MPYKSPTLFRLHELLSNLFTPGELRSFIRLRLDAELARSLPVVGTYNEVVYHVIIAFEQYGYLSSELFDLLVAVRPLREPEIRRIQEEVVPGSQGTMQKRLAAHARVMKQLDELREDGVSDNNWRKLVDVIREGFRDLGPGRAIKSFGFLTRFLSKRLQAGWDRLLERREKATLPSDGPIARSSNPLRAPSAGLIHSWSGTSSVVGKPHHER